ncbi:840_t:CDS:10, partial [Funneliformis geosporum]
QHECLRIFLAGGLHEFADSQFGHIFAYGEHQPFRTTVEYLVKLLETQAFKENSFTTGLLDMLISDENQTAEKPDKMLAITSDTLPLYLNGSRIQASVRALTDDGSLSPGKLVRFLVESGDHLKKGDAYAEIEVMKMYMPLIAIEDVRHALPFEEQLPAMNPPVLVGDKAHQRYCKVKNILESALLRISNETHSQGLEDPAKRSKEMIDNYSLDFVKPSDLSILFSNSNKREEEAVHDLRDGYKNDLDKVVSIFLSHSKFEAKNNLILHLLDQIRPANVGQALDKFYSPILEKLAELGGRLKKAAVIESHYGDDDSWVNVEYHTDQSPFMVSWNFSLHSATTDSPTGSVESP